MKPAWLAILSAAAMVLGALPASAQMVVAAKSGVVNYIEGQVFLNNQAVESSITKYPEMKENGVLRTAAGRAEVLLTPGVILRMGENSTLKMITNRLVDTRVELESGSAVVEAVQTAKDNNVTVVVKNGAAAIVKTGIYRFDTEPAQVKVFRGEAAVEVAGETTPVGTGHSVALDNPNVTVAKFNAEDTDALDHWGRQRGELLAMANPSTARSLMGGPYSSGFVGDMYGGMGMAAGMGGCNPYWGFNSWYSMYTYVPCSGYSMSPYGFGGFYSPIMVNQVFSNPGVFGLSRGITPSGRSAGLGVNPRGYSASVAPGSGSMGRSVGSAGGGAVGHGGGGAMGGGGAAAGHGGGGGGGAGGGGGHSR